MDRRETLKHILEAYRCNPTPRQLGSAIKGIEGLFADCETQTVAVGDRQEAFRRSVWAWNFKNKEKYSADIIEAFINYWNRVEPDGRLNHEKQPVFKIGGRLATFSKNQSKIDTNKRIAQFKRASGEINPLY